MTHSAQQIADELLAAAEFKALKLGTFLNTPDGQFAAAVLDAMAPPLYRQGTDVMIKALQLVAKMQQDAARDAVCAEKSLTLAEGAVVAIGAAALVAFANGNN